MNDMDWNAALSSEIFKSYLANELKKEAAAKKTSEQIAQEELDALNMFEEFQLKVNSSKKQKAVFKRLQHAFQTDEKLTAGVDPKFVDVVLLLNID